MRPPPESVVIREVANRLAELLGAPPEAGTVRRPDRSQLDAIVSVGEFTFIVEWKGSGTVAQVTRAAQQVRAYDSPAGKRTVPLVAVPFMGPAGQEVCARAGVGWLDLSGNATLTAPGLRVRVVGEPNRFKRAGRPSSAFAPKSSRIARWLLMHPGQPMRQREIARATDMDEGLTSRVVARLERDGLIVRRPEGAIAVKDPDLLLDAWREDYDFGKHRVRRGHVAARSADALLHQLGDVFRESKALYAVTGLAGAWLITQFAGYRVVTFYLAESPRAPVLEELGFREDTAGSNVWLVLPADEGVFQGASSRDGLRCVHPVQVYLDLKGHPERAVEAAERVRRSFQWHGHD